MTAKRRCLGCGHSYPVQDSACPKCGSHAGETVEVKPAPKPRRGAPRRKA